MGIGNWIMNFRDGVTKAVINALVSMVLIGIGGALGFILTSARIGATTGQEQKRLSEEFTKIKAHQEITQNNQQQMADSFSDAFDSLSTSIKDVNVSVEFLSEKVAEMKVDMHENQIDIKLLLQKK